MKKDKKWLRKTILKNVREEYFGESIETDKLFELIDQLDEPELPVIPQFVADWIEKNKNKYNIKTALGNIDAQEDEICDWVLYNLDTFVRALLDGYTIEKKTVYYVILVESEDKEYGQALYKDFNYGGDKVVSTHIETFSKRIALEADNFHFTEQEIKAIDERYLAFKVEVPE